VIRTTLPSIPPFSESTLLLIHRKRPTGCVYHPSPPAVVRGSTKRQESAGYSLCAPLGSPGGRRIESRTSVEWTRYEAGQWRGEECRHPKRPLISSPSARRWWTSSPSSRRTGCATPRPSPSRTSRAARPCAGSSAWPTKQARSSRSTRTTAPGYGPIRRKCGTSSRRCTSAST
jgi:hypothetical protein